MARGASAFPRPFARSSARRTRAGVYVCPSFFEPALEGFGDDAAASPCISGCRRSIRSSRPRMTTKLSRFCLAHAASAAGREGPRAPARRVHRACRAEGSRRSSSGMGQKFQIWDAGAFRADPGRASRARAPCVRAAREARNERGHVPVMLAEVLDGAAARATARITSTARSAAAVMRAPFSKPRIAACSASTAIPMRSRAGKSSWRIIGGRLDAGAWRILRDGALLAQAARRQRRRRARSRRFVVPDRRSRARLFVPRRRSARHAHEQGRPNRRRCREHGGRSDARRHHRALGEERHARRIARAIIAARPLTRTARAGRDRFATRSAPRAARLAIHPATRTFQALRIHVNDELGELERGLEAASACCARRPSRRRLVPFAGRPHRQAVSRRARDAAAARLAPCAGSAAHARRHVPASRHSRRMSPTRCRDRSAIPARVPPACAPGERLAA